MIQGNAAERGWVAAGFLPWRRPLLRFAALLLLLCLAPALEAKTLAAKKAAAGEQFDVAEDLRSALERKPERRRTRQDYERVVEAYRSVYRIAPTSPRADPSAFAVAELLAEVGRDFKDTQALQDAVEQYQFLRREYPGSPRRFEALLMIGDLTFDLGDKERARATYQDFIRRYPHNAMAVEAARKLEAIRTPSDNKSATQDEIASDSPVNKAVRESLAETPAPSPFASRPAGSSAVRATLTSVQYTAKPESTRLAIELDGEARYQTGLVPQGNRLFFDVQNTRLDRALIGKSFEFNDGLVRRVRVAPYRPGMTRVVLELENNVDYAISTLPNPWRIVIDLRHHKSAPVLSASAKSRVGTPEAPPSPNGEKPALSSASPSRNNAEKSASAGLMGVANGSKPANGMQASAGGATVPPAAMPLETAAASVTQAGTYPAAPPPQVAQASAEAPKGKRIPATREAQPTASGERSLTRVLGLKIGRIVIDAGHGGHDTGTIGPNGLREKDLVLDIALRLGKLLQGRLGADVVYTRDDDTFVPLETRTAIANQEKADLFISIHANSSSDADARGVETYYLNFTSSRDALQLAARENAGSEKTIHELQDLVKNIALREKIDESREFAADVQRSLYTGLAAKNSALRNRGVKKAPFIVLIGAHMPSILAEVSFVSNPSDERRLSTGDYRQKVAESLYRGIARYAGGLSGVKMAAAAPKTTAP